MSRFSSLTLFLCVISAISGLSSSDVSEDDEPFQLFPGRPQLISLSPTSEVNFFVNEIKSTSQFLIMQVHTQHTSLTLSLKQTSPASPVRITGNSVGMVVMNDVSVASVSWSVRVADVNSSAGENVSTLVMVQEYDDYVPIPGGCNQVFSLENDPNIRLTSTDYHTEVWFQWARVGQSDPSASCEAKTDTSRLSYEVYVKHVSENDEGSDALFEAVRSMLNAELIRKNALKITTVGNDGTQKSRVAVTSQRGQGAVYGVVVTDKQLGLSASYVSAITYGCNYTAGDCGLRYEALEWVMAVVCAATGLFLLILGHTFLRTEMVVFGLCGTGLVCFTFLSMTDLSAEVSFSISAVVGAAGGAIWLVVWMVFLFPTVSVLLPGLCAGYLLAGTIFFTPFANISWWLSSLNYGLVFTCLTLLFAVLMLWTSRTLNIVSCALVGGYCVTMVPAIFLRSSLRLIVLNVIRHASVPGYASILVVSPWHLTDGLLTGLWALLMVVAIGWQFYRSKGKPHFPNQHQRRSPGHRRNGPHIRDGVISEPPPPAVDDNSPLLDNQEAVSSGQQSPSEMASPLA